MEKSIYVHDEITHNSSAAAQVLPILFQEYLPKSIIDAGCGLGNWIEVAKKLGVESITGVDGSYVNRSLLKIAEHEFVEKDLTKPFDLQKKFDLAICLEVAEHLPDSSADGLVASLTQHADVIMFSAALPGQGGQNHINEQWPDYWQKYFAKYGYEMIDYFRPKIWNNQKIERWYRQNMFLVVRSGHSLSTGKNQPALSLIHPELFKAINEQQSVKIKQLQTAIEKLKKRDLVGKIAKLFKK
jgi:SAM-dependent methyltransferase